MSPHFRGGPALVLMGAVVGFPSSVQSEPQGESW